MEAALGRRVVLGDEEGSVVGLGCTASNALDGGWLEGGEILGATNAVGAGEGVLQDGSVIFADEGAGGDLIVELGSNTTFPTVDDFVLLEMGVLVCGAGAGRSGAS